MISLKKNIFLCFTLLLPISVQAKDTSFTLPKIHQNIISDYKNIAHINTQGLTEAIRSGKALIFDVREPEEYAVSHIDGALLLLPSTNVKIFLNQHEKKLMGKTVIFYCSVGVRSTKMANYLQAVLKKKGAAQIYNLEGGIFAHANKEQRLVNKTGITKYVHPYDTHWGTLLNSKEMWRFKP